MCKKPSYAGAMAERKAGKNPELEKLDSSRVERRGREHVAAESV
jgi:hypothetical protein